MGYPRNERFDQQDLTRWQSNVMMKKTVDLVEWDTPSWAGTHSSWKMVLADYDKCHDCRMDTNYWE